MGDVKRPVAAFTIALSIAATACGGPVVTRDDQGPDVVALRGPYLGQVPPGTAPVLFAPGALCTRYQSHSAPAFSPDGRFVFWSVWLAPFPTEVVLFMEQRSGAWTEPEVAPFSGTYSDGQPFFSSQGSRLFFNSKRPVAPGGDLPLGRGTWVVERDGDGWTEPQPFLAGVYQGGPLTTMAPDGSVYFTGPVGPGRNDDIFVMGFVEGEYVAPVAVSGAANSPDSEFAPAISPDGDILVFTRFQLVDGFARTKLFASFRRPDGSWSAAQNLGEEVNRGNSRFPQFSPDGRHLFFTSDLTPYPEVTEAWTLSRILETNEGTCGGTENVYWIDASVLDALRN